MIIFQGGDITWIPPYQLTTACKFDMHWFPFDEQSKQIKNLSMKLLSHDFIFVLDGFVDIQWI